jgi:hypothetical protein
MLQSAWITFAVGLPMLHLVALFVLFFVPFSYQFQRGLFHAVEVIGAWASLEVLACSHCMILLVFTHKQVAIVSIMAALLQLPLFTSFLVGDKCDLVNMLLRECGIPPLLHHSQLHGPTLRFAAAASQSHILQLRARSRGRRHSLLPSLGAPAALVLSAVLVLCRVSNPRPPRGIFLLCKSVVGMQPCPALCCA